MNNKFLIMSHGFFADGCKSTLDIFLGELNPFDAINAYIDDKNPAELLQDYIATVTPEQTLVICTDVMGGSINQIVLPLLERENTFIIAGVNIPLLMELSTLTNATINNEIIKGLINSTRENSIFFMNEVFHDLSPFDQSEDE